MSILTENNRQNVLKKQNNETPITTVDNIITYANESSVCILTYMNKEIKKYTKKLNKKDYSGNIILSLQIST
jgi:hypothetical protein